MDHIEPHRGDKAKFWDPTNWQPMAKECHDRKTAREEGGWRGGGRVAKAPEAKDDAARRLDARLRAHPADRKAAGRCRVTEAATRDHRRTRYAGHPSDVAGAVAYAFALHRANASTSPAALRLTEVESDTPECMAVVVEWRREAK